MRSIRNPYAGQEGYNCFGCSPDNELGLQMQFVEEGEEIISRWEPKNHLQGYRNVLHGGIQATLMDEIASWWVQVKMKTAGVTLKMNITYKKPAYMNNGPYVLRASLRRMRRNLADVEVVLTDVNEQICTTGILTYYCFPEQLAKEKFYYPESGSFFED